MSKDNKRHDKFSPVTVVMLVVLCIYCFILLFMLLYMLMQVFKFPLDFNKNPIWLPTTKDKQIGFTFINFKILSAYTETEWMNDVSKVARVPLTDVVVNSIVYALGGSLMNAAVTCVMAYLTAKYAYFYSFY